MLAPTEFDDDIPDWAGRSEPPSATTAAREPAVNEAPSAGANSVPVSFPMLPGELARSYVLLGDIAGSGNEADIFLVRRADDRPSQPSGLVLKLYRPKRAPSAEVLLAIGELDEAYVVKQIEVGEENGRSYEILEHLPAGSLDTVLAAQPSRSPDERSRLLASVAKQMIAILDYLHGLPKERTLVHRDIKPANILLRSTDPLALVVADFGTARMLEFEEAGTVFAGTRSYTAPEGQSDAHGGAVVVSPALDWWSLGIILLEIADGAHPFDGLSGSEQHQLLKGQIGFKLEALAPELAEWAGLLAGLLQRDPKRRWSGIQARAWLEREPALRATGQTLVAAEQRLGPTTPVPGVRPFEFMGTLYSDERKLGRALARHWDQAVTRLGRGALLKWLEGEPSKNDAASVLQDLELKTVEGEKLTAEQQLIEFLFYLDPNAMPERDRGRNHTHMTIKHCLQAEAGLASAQAAVARMLLQGTVLQPDQPRAEELAKAAARQGDVAGQALAEEIAQFRQASEKAADDDAAALLDVARRQEAGRGCVRDLAAAQRNYERAADLGNAEAQSEIGSKAYREQRYDIARLPLEQAAAQGHSNAQNHLGAMYLDGRGVPRDDVKAVALFRLAAEAGDEWAMNNLAYCLYEGKGCARDDTEIYLWSQRAADAGQNRGQYYAACCYLKGIGIPVDQERAVGLFRQAWENGFVAAGYQLGRAYEFGWGVEQSFHVAADWYFIAGKKGHAQSAYKQGEFWLRAAELFGAQTKPSEVLWWFELAAANGDYQALIELGHLHRNGVCVPQDRGKALEFYGRAADAGLLGEAHYWRGSLLAADAVTDPELEQVFEAFERGADNGWAAAQLALARLCETGRGCAPDPERALELYRKAADQGLAEAQYELGRIYENGILLPSDTEESSRWYEKSANGGHAPALFKRGQAFLAKSGPDQFAIAASDFRKAAENGHAEAQFNLGVVLREGKGVPKDLGEAAAWFKKAADQGFAGAQYQLGLFYDEGLGGILQDDARAAKFYRLAAEQGTLGAQNILGWFYEIGRGVPQDMSQAALWYGKAADGNFWIAIRNIAECHCFGFDGIPKNLVEAKRRYRQLAENHPEALAEAAQRYRQYAVDQHSAEAREILALLGQPASYQDDRKTGTQA
ncbi:MAG: protein kinase [Beijerinckiaceae bacterium]|nr:protein kinase [Beijerinckiaceae bacterium]